MDNNTKTNYKARELRKIYLESPCLYMKLVLHKNFSNKFNIFNQVSIINLEFFGNPILQEGNDLFLKEPTIQILENDIDDICKEKIKILKNNLDESIKNEDYGLSKKLKNNIEKLKLFGKKISELERNKKKFIELEDFDSAKIIKIEIDRLRSKVKNIDKQIGDINHNSYLNSHRMNLSIDLNKSNENISIIKEDIKENDILIKDKYEESGQYKSFLEKDKEM
jgi:hypothetical protein